MINRVVKQPCQIANEVRDMTSGPWQCRQVTEKAALLASKRQRRDRAERAVGSAQLMTRPGLSDMTQEGRPHHQRSQGAPDPHTLCRDRDSMTWPGPSAWLWGPEAKQVLSPWGLLVLQTQTTKKIE